MKTLKFKKKNIILLSTPIINISTVPTTISSMTGW